MAALPTLDASACERLRERLEALDGVVRAVVDVGSDVVWLISQPAAEQQPLEAAASQVLRSAGVDTNATRVRVATHPDSGIRRRVRFERLERIFESSGALRVRVTLEWKGELFEGEAVGETGQAVELRTAAAAALEAVNAVLGEDRGLRLTGVKGLRAFDTEMVVVSLYRTGGEPQRFVGAVMAEPDPLHGAARAVLHALNRTIGNFLHTSD
ncbi:MAG TPA: hypothetical protein VF158_16710 [Longimicrobiales bacterium]